MKSRYFSLLNIHSYMACRPGEGEKSSERKAAIFPFPGTPSPFLATFKKKENAAGIFYLIGPCRGMKNVSSFFIGEVESFSPSPGPS